MHIVIQISGPFKLSSSENQKQQMSSNFFRFVFLGFVASTLKQFKRLVFFSWHESHTAYPVSMTKRLCHPFISDSSSAFSIQPIFSAWEPTTSTEVIGSSYVAGGISARIYACGNASMSLGQLHYGGGMNLDDRSLPCISANDHPYVATAPFFFTDPSRAASSPGTGAAGLSYRGPSLLLSRYLFSALS